GGEAMIFAVLTLGSFALLAYAYVGYPGLLWLLSKIIPGRPRRSGEPAEWPRISIIVSAYNEEHVIADRLQNLHALDCPRDRLDLRSPVATGNLDGTYWRYETWIKTLESHFGAVLGANGAIYAFHRARYRRLPAAAIVDDFLVPMLMRLHAGGEVFFVPAARAYETSPAQVRHELRRRVRIGAGDLQALLWTWRLLLPDKGLV